MRGFGSQRTPLAARLGALGVGGLLGLAGLVLVAALGCAPREPNPDLGERNPDPPPLAMLSASEISAIEVPLVTDPPLRPWRAQGLNVKRLEGQYMPEYVPLTYRAPGMDEERHLHLVDLLEILRRDLTSRRFAAEQELGELGETAAPYVKQLLNEPRSHVRCAAVKLLAAYGPPEYLPDVIDRLQDESGDVRLFAYSRLKRRTGRHFPYSTTAPSEERQVAVEQWMAWFAENYPKLARARAEEQARQARREAETEVVEKPPTPPTSGDVRVPPASRVPVQTGVKHETPVEPAWPTPYIYEAPLGLRRQQIESGQR